MSSEKVLPDRTELIYNKILKLVIGQMNKTSDGRFHSSSLNTFNNSGYSAAILRPALRYWVGKGFFSYDQKDGSGIDILTGTRGYEYWELTHIGLCYSIEQTIINGSQDKISSSNLAIPASDRFVSIDDNSPVIDDAKAAFSKLSDAIRNSNSLFAASEDRIQASQEIDYLKELISKPRVHLLAVWDMAKTNLALRALAEQTKNDFIKQATLLVYEKLDKLLVFLYSFF